MHALGRSVVPTIRHQRPVRTHPSCSRAPGRLRGETFFAQEQGPSPVDGAHQGACQTSVLFCAAPILPQDAWAPGEVGEICSSVSQLLLPEEFTSGTTCMDSRGLMHALHERMRMPRARRLTARTARSPGEPWQQGWKQQIISRSLGPLRGALRSWGVGVGA